MTAKNYRTRNRYWIIITYLNLLALLVFFNTGRSYHWPLFTVIFSSGLLVIFLISFIRTFIKTGFWSMVHTSPDNLDERELQVNLNSLKYAYSIFTILCLIIVYIFALTEFLQIDIVLAGGLLILAHTLPAAIAGWNETYVATENN